MRELQKEMFVSRPDALSFLDELREVSGVRQRSRRRRLVCQHCLDGTLVEPLWMFCESVATYPIFVLPLYQWTKRMCKS